MPRILNITAQKPDNTGSGVFLAENVRAFHALGCEQAVIAGIGPNDEPRFPEGVLFRPVRFETPRLPFPVVGMSDEMPYKATRYRDLTPEMLERFCAAFDEALDDVLERFQPDLVLCHHLYLVCALTAHRDWDVPVVGISHSTDIRQMRQIPLERDYVREGVARLSGIFALHEAQKADIVETYGVSPRMVTVMGTGYNSGVFRRAEGCRRPGSANVVYAGKIWEKKGVPSLLRAVDALTDAAGAILPAPAGDVACGADGPETPGADVLSGRHLRLRLAGGYSNRDEYERIRAQASGCQADIAFLGRLPQADLARAYNEADVFVLPSFFEGLPLVTIEALACGCKVVVTDLPGIRPWLSANVPDAPVRYVAPPRMRNVDEPDADDLPRFEADLARAIRASLADPAPSCEVSHLSWEGLCGRMLEWARRA
ncbi:MAG: glycosyltransferase [Eggerthellaceae bacterium]|jgi:glycosyltransferase involved in cell wall biosynthesis